MSYSTLENSSDDLQRNREEIERKWHFIGRAYVCHKGGFQHEHLSEQNCLSCTGENIRTEQKQKYEQLLNDKDLEIAAEKSKIQVCYKGGFMHEHLSADEAQKCVGDDMETKWKQEHEKYLKDQDVKIAVEQTRRMEIEQTMETKRVESVEETKRVKTVEETKRMQIRANREHQKAEEQLNRDIKMRRLEMEDSAKNMETSRVEELVNNVCDLIISINQRRDHGSTLNQRSQLSLLPVRQDLDEWI